MANIEHQLLVHSLCPYAERSLLLASYKGLLPQLNSTECDLVNKPEILVQNNPVAKVPTLLVTRDGKTTGIYETLVVNNYLARLPGKAIVPYNEDGTADPLEVSVQNTFLLTRPDKLIMPAMHLAKGGYNEETIENIRAVLKEANDLLQGAQYFGKASIGVDELSLADIHFFTPVERIVILNGTNGEDVLRGDFQELIAWYERLRSLEWVQAVIQPPERYLNLGRRFARGEHRGLEVPLTNYDN